MKYTLKNLSGQRRNVTAENDQAAVHAAWNWLHYTDLEQRRLHYTGQSQVYVARADGTTFARIELTLFDA